MNQKIILSCLLSVFTISSISDVLASPSKETKSYKGHKYNKLTEEDQKHLGKFVKLILKDKKNFPGYGVIREGKSNDPKTGDKNVVYYSYTFMENIDKVLKKSKEGKELQESVQEAIKAKDFGYPVALRLATEELLLKAASEGKGDKKELRIHDMPKEGSKVWNISTLKEDRKVTKEFIHMKRDEYARKLAEWVKDVLTGAHEEDHKKGRTYELYKKNLKKNEEKLGW